MGIPCLFRSLPTLQHCCVCTRCSVNAARVGFYYFNCQGKFPGVSSSTSLPKPHLRSCLAQYKNKNLKKKKLFKVRLKNILGGNANQIGAPRVSRWGSSSARTPNTWSLSCAHVFPCFSFQQSYFPTFSHTQTLAAWEPLRPYTPTLSRGDLPLLPSTRGSSPSLRMA